MNVTEEVYYSNSNLPYDAVSYMGFIQGLLNKIPLEYLPSALVIHSTEEVPYEESYHETWLRVTYQRPENDSETAERLFKEVQNKQRQEASDLRQLALITKRLGL